MKIIVDELPDKYAEECVFCSNIYYGTCGINHCDCAITKKEECPYLMTIDDYLSEEKHNEDC